MHLATSVRHQPKEAAGCVCAWDEPTALHAGGQWGLFLMIRLYPSYGEGGVDYYVEFDI
jgi:hypothetical protein